MVLFLKLFFICGFSEIYTLVRKMFQRYRCKSMHLHCIAFALHGLPLEIMFTMVGTMSLRLAHSLPDLLWSTSLSYKASGEGRQAATSHNIFLFNVAYYLVCISAATAFQSSEPQSQAVLVGTVHYPPPSWLKLEGGVHRPGFLQSHYSEGFWPGTGYLWPPTGSSS